MKRMRRFALAAAIAALLVLTIANAALAGLTFNGID
jgi:hypothetical protein